MAADGCILVADDHPLMRGALAQAVCQTLPRAEILEAGTLDQAIAMVRARPSDGIIDLILLDLNMPGMNGFSGLLLIRAEFPAVPVVVVSASEDQPTMARAFDYGAAGFIPKSVPSGRIAEAIHTVLRGDLWFPAHGESAPHAEDAKLADRVFGGLVPLVGLSLISATGNNLAGLAYPMLVAAIGVVVAMKYMGQTHLVKIWDEVEPRR